MFVLFHEMFGVDFNSRLDKHSKSTSFNEMVIRIVGAFCQQKKQFKA